MRGSRAIQASLLAALLGVSSVATAQFGDEVRAIGATEAQADMGQAVGDACPFIPVGTDLRERCTDIVVEALAGPSDRSGAQGGLQAMAPDAGGAVGALNVDGGQEHLTTVQGRTASIRGVGALQLGGTFAQSLASEDGGTRGMAAGSQMGKLGFFVNGSFSTGDRDTTSREAGFDFDTFSVTGGVDYMITPQAVLGVALGYTTTDTDIANSGGEIDSDSITVLGYASWFPNSNAYIDGVVSYTASEHDQDRTVRYSISGIRSATVDQTAFSSTDSDDIALRVQGGYDWFQGRSSYGIYGRFEWANTDIDGFTERMSNSSAAGSGLALVIESQDVTSAPLTFGVQATRAYTLGETTWFPQIYAEYTHEFDNDNDPTVGYFADDPNQVRFRLRTDEPDRDYFTLGVKAATEIGSGGSAYFLYEALLAHSHLDTHTFEVGLRLQY